MPTDAMLDFWLDAWEMRRHQEPGITPDDFMGALPPDIPADLRHELRCAIVDLDWITGVMKQMKGCCSNAKESAPEDG